MQDLNILRKKTASFIRIIKTGEKAAEDFLKETVTAAVETGVVKVKNQEIFVEIYEKNPRLIILGGGHVSLPVAEIGKLLGFHVTVMDDREDFVTQERFPQVDERITGDFETLSEKIPPYENAWYVVVTRGHAGRIPPVQDRSLRDHLPISG